MNRRLLAPLSAALLLLLLSQGCDRRRALLSDDDKTPLSFTPTTLPDAEVGQHYRAFIEVSGMETPFAYVSLSKGRLPDGLFYGVGQEDKHSIEVSGDPTRAGEYEFEITVACLGTQRSGQTGSQKFSLRVK